MKRAERIHATQPIPRANGSNGAGRIYEIFLSFSTSKWGTYMVATWLPRPPALMTFEGTVMQASSGVLNHGSIIPEAKRFPKKAPDGCLLSTKVDRSN
ncbi:unnamed protein product [Urochloa humidicola]